MTTMTDADAEKMTNNSTRALVLAAGFGTRLRPITEDTPKPLIPVIAHPLIEHAFFMLDAAGIREVAVNAHYHAPSLIDAYANGAPFGQKITFSHETPDILGTGGGIKRLEDFLSASDPFIVLNGDTLSKPDLSQLIREHKKSGAVATMVLRRDRRNSRFGPVAVSSGGAVVDIAGRLGKACEDQGVFIGAHAISPEIFRHMPQSNSFCINADVYLPLIQKSPGSVRAHFSDTPFFDLGTPDDYAAAQFVILDRKPCPFPYALSDLRETAPGVFISPDARVDRSAKLNAPCAICAGAVVEKDTQLGPEIVIGANARAPEGCKIAKSIVMPDGVVNKSRRKMWNRIIGPDYVLSLA